MFIALATGGLELRSQCPTREASISAKVDLVPLLVINGPWWLSSS